MLYTGIMDKTIYMLWIFFLLQALQYCEAISRVILNSPTLFQPILVKLVYEVMLLMRWGTIIIFISYMLVM